MIQRVAVACLLAIQLHLSAAVEIQTSSLDIYYKGSSELIGSVWFEVTDDAFADASPANPTFIRVSLSDGLVLNETLVDQTLPALSVSEPIYLPVRVRSNDPERRVNVPTDAVAIVRMVAGETEIWMRVQRSSSSWLRDSDGAVFPAAPDTPLIWMLGSTARSSAHDNADPDRSNLPFSTRAPIPRPNDAALAQSTLMCVDARDSTLTVSGTDAIAEVSVAFFGADAEIAPGVFAPGTALEPVGGSPSLIARGKDRVLDFRYLALSSQVPSRRIGSLIRTQTRHRLQIESPYGPGRLDTDLFDESYWRLSFPENSLAGFLPDDAVDVYFWGTHAPPATRVVPVAETAFEAGGQTLYRTIDVIWENGTVNLDFVQPLMDCRVYVSSDYFHADAATRRASWFFSLDMYVATHRGSRDDPPFDLETQNRRCAPSPFHAPLDLSVPVIGILPVAETPLLADVVDSLNLFPWADLVMVGDVAYGYGNGRIDVIDVCDPILPNSMHAVPLDVGTGDRFEVSGNRAIGEVDGGWALFSIEDPGMIEVVGVAETDGPLIDLAIDGDLAVVSVMGGDTIAYRLEPGGSIAPIATISATGLVTLRGQQVALLDEETVGLYTLSDSAAPRTADWTVPDARDVMLVDHVLYVAAWNTLEVYDITDPELPVAQPSLTVETGGPLEVAGSLLVTGSTGSVVDISLPAVPVVVAPAPGFSSSDIVAVSESGKMIIAPTSHSGLYFYDTSAPEAIERTARWIIELPTSSSFDRVEGGFMIVGRAGLLATVPEDEQGLGPPIFATLPGMGATRVIEGLVEAGLLVILENNGRVRRFDLSDPRHPRQIDKYDVGSRTLHLERLGNLVLVSDSSTVRILDPENGWHEVALLDGTETVDGETWEAYDIAIDGSLLYVSTRHGFRIYDLSDPSVPVQVGTWSGHAVSSLRVRGDRALLMGNVLIDLTHRDEPVRLGSVADNTTVYDLLGSTAVQGGDSFDNCGLVLIDFSNPEDPAWTCREPSAFFSGILAEGESVYSLQNGYQKFFYGALSGPLPLALQRRVICTDPLYSALPHWPELGLSDLLVRQAAGCDWTE